MKPLFIGLIVGSLVIIFLFIGIFIYTGGLPFEIVEGPQTLYTANCADGSSIALEVAVYRQPFDFELGDAFGYGIFYKPANGKEIVLYDDSYSTAVQRQRGVEPAPYSSWSFNGKSYSGPAATYDFTPLPATTTNASLRVFELPSGTYNRDIRPPEWDGPPYMNIFLPPSIFSEKNFNTIGDCLAANQNAINGALANIPSHIPSGDARYYHALKLGGVVYGLPPFADSQYIAMMDAVWGESAQQIAIIPQIGYFTVIQGQMAQGVINGKNVSVSVDASSNPIFTVDGHAFTNPFNPGTIPGVDSDIAWYSESGLVIGRPQCQNGKECSTEISPMTTSQDGSATFAVWQCIDNQCQDASPSW